MRNFPPPLPMRMALTPGRLTSISYLLMKIDDWSHSTLRTSSNMRRIGLRSMAAFLLTASLACTRNSPPPTRHDGPVKTEKLTAEVRKEELAEVGPTVSTHDLVALA